MVYLNVCEVKYGLALCRIFAFLGLVLCFKGRNANSICSVTVAPPLLRQVSVNILIFQSSSSFFNSSQAIASPGSFLASQASFMSILSSSSCNKGELLKIEACSITFIMIRGNAHT